jgi:hypothetical protein
MYLKRLAPLLAALALVATASGCATIGTLQTADTLGKGKFQMGLEPSVWGAIASGGTILVPNVTLSARYGLSDNFDIGGRVGSNGFELNGKLMFTKPKAPGLIVSLAPSIGGFALAAGGAAAGTFYLQVPVLLGFPIGGGSQFVLGPKVMDWFFFGAASTSSGGTTSSGSASGNMLALGTSVGVSLKLGSGFRLLPEVSFAYPLITAASAGSGGTSAGASSVGTSSGVLTQISLALLFGG